MSIKLGEKYLIESDKYNWILKEKRVTNPDHPLSKSNEPTEKFVDVGYFGKIEHLLNSILNKELKESEINIIQDIKSTLFQIEKRLKIEISERENG